MKADAWDAVYAAKDDRDAETRLRRLPVPNDVRATLWDLRVGQAVTPSLPSTGKPSSNVQTLTRENFSGVMADVDRYEDERTRGMREHLPTMGGAVGGVLGGIPGAALGGAAGEAFRQLSSEAPPPTGTAAATGIATQGGTQALAEGTGRAAGAVMGKTATFLMNRAANVSDRLAREFPDLSQTLIDNAIRVTQGGYGKAKGMLLAAKAQARAALTKAETAGATIPVQLTDDLAASFKTAVLERAMKTGGATPPTGSALTVATERLNPATRNLLTSIDDAVTKGVPFKLTPTQADLLKTQLQRESRNLYVAMRGPNGTPAIAENAAVKADFAAELNSAIDAAASGYKAANATAQKMLGATRAVQQAVRPGKNLYMAMVRPTTGAVLGSIAGQQQGQPGVGAVIGAAAATPAGMSSLAITLANPAVQQFVRQLPRALGQQITDYFRTQPALGGQTVP